MKKKIVAAAAAAVLGATALTGCGNDSDVASENVSKAADSFQVYRQIVFYNGITGEYIAEVDGLCAVGNQDSAGQVSVTCKVAKGKYIKNILGLSDNVTWFALQTSPVAVSDQRYKVIFKPSTVVPDFDLR